jgi:hypothetical protein
MRLAVFLVAALLAAPAALAQPASAPAAPAAKTPAPVPSDGHTVSGVTVEAPRLPTKECNPRDRACINRVVAELRLRYPEQLKRFCFQREMRTMRDQAMFGATGLDGVGTTYETASALKIACTPDKPKDKGS